MGLSHYKCRVFEPCHYNSSYSVGAITILAEFESCHYVRLTPLWAHVQAYAAIWYLRMDGVALHRVDKAAAPFLCSQPLGGGQLCPYANTYGSEWLHTPTHGTKEASGVHNGTIQTL